ncbi:MAG: hypothetical protein Q4P20_04640 [Eubacteriales bacterium]|nr:hypothetical protein [Eubacteriales bacterium]
MEEMNTSFSAEELEFCISALQLEIEDTESAMQGASLGKEERIRMTAYIQKLDKLQDEFLRENNSFKSVDLLQVYQLVQKERHYLNQILDRPDITGKQQQEAQRHLRTANSLLRKLKKIFQAFGVDTSKL